jgi:hypothetical protein
LFLNGQFSRFSVVLDLIGLLTAEGVALLGGAPRRSWSDFTNGQQLAAKTHQICCR